jgi:hypothetical protein
MPNIDANLHHAIRFDQAIPYSFWAAQAAEFRYCLWRRFDLWLCRIVVSFNLLGAKSGFLRRYVSTSGLAPAMNATASSELIAALDAATKNGSPEGKALLETLFVSAAQYTMRFEPPLGPAAGSEPPLPAARAAR